MNNLFFICGCGAGALFATIAMLFIMALSHRRQKEYSDTTIRLMAERNDLDKSRNMILRSLSIRTAFNSREADATAIAIPSNATTENYEARIRSLAENSRKSAAMIYNLVEFMGVRKIGIPKEAPQNATVTIEEQPGNYQITISNPVPLQTESK